jgi:hypothetical protein
MDGTNGSTMFTDSNSGPVTVKPASPFGNFYTYDGVYQAFLPTGQYTFTIAYPGFAPQTWSVSISPGQTGTGQNVYLEQSQIPAPEFYQVNHVAKAVSSVNGASIDTTQSPPFGTGMGKFVAASKQYLTIPASSNFTFGSNNFAVDFWWKPNSLPRSGNVMVFFGVYQNSSNYYNLQIYSPSTGTYQLQFNVDNAGSWTSVISENVSLSTGTIYHIEIDRNRNAWYLFQNGTLLGSASSSISMPTLTGTFEIDGQNGGSYMDGWLKEFRVSNGIARHTSNFTPPTAEYTPDQYTVLLLHMDGTNGSTMFTDSNSGPVTVKPASP